MRRRQIVAATHGLSDRSVRGEVAELVRENLHERLAQQLGEARDRGARVVFDNNYRGDHVALAKKKDRRSRRRGGTEASGATAPELAPSENPALLELTEAKVSANPVFIMRLAADKVDISFYEQQAISRNMPLTSGIGSPEIDRNSIEDLEAAKAETREIARSHVAAIRNVCANIDLPEDNHVSQAWPSHIYFEDVNLHTQFDLVEIILEEVYGADPIQRKA